jgi:hypothetical protein
MARRAPHVREPMIEAAVLRDRASADAVGTVAVTQAAALANREHSRPTACSLLVSVGDPLVKLLRFDVAVAP